MRDREKILDIFEENTGGRLIQSYICPGGLMYDIQPNFAQRVKDLLAYLRKKLPEYDRLLTGNVIFLNRTQGIGRMSKEMAIDYAVTGPAGRGSGFSCYVRRYEPYSAYDRVEFKEILYTEGDTFARYKVRMDEMWESMKIIDQLIDQIPDGPHTAKMKPVIKLPAGEYYQRVETAKGNGIYIISDGEKNP